MWPLCVDPNSDAVDSRSRQARVLLPEVHHESGAACEDSALGDPVQGRKADMDNLSGLSKTF